MAAAGVLVVALAAVGLWLLGSQNGTLPTHERAPADGGVHNQTKRPAGADPVAPVGDPVVIDESRSSGQQPAPHRPAAKPGHPEAKPSAGNDEAQPPEPTSADAPEPTTTVPTTDPPTSSEEATTEPAPSDAVEEPDARLR